MLPVSMGLSYGLLSVRARDTEEGPHERRHTHTHTGDRHHTERMTGHAARIADTRTRGIIRE